MATHWRRCVVPVVLIGLLVAPLGACSDRDGRAGPHSSPVSQLPTATASPSRAPTQSVEPSGPGAIPAAAFGMHVNRANPDFWPDVDVGAFRIWNPDTTWGALEPSRGSWDFERLDLRVAQAETREASVLLVLSHPPAWAASRPEIERYGGSPSMPSDLDAWRTYVRAVATRYAGRIEAYEIWNEPNLYQFYVGTPQRLAELTTIAAEEIRAADPDALVVSPGLSARTPGSVAFFQNYLDALAPDAVDIVGIHLYPYAGDGPESMVDLVTQFRGLADAAGLAGKPMWNTEIGYGRTPTDVITGDAAAAMILRTYLVLPAYGVARSYWYAWDDRKFVGLFLVQPDLVSDTPAAEAFTEAQRWLVGAVVVGCSDLGEGLWQCDVTRDGQDLVIAWKLGPPTSYAVPEGATVQYPFTYEPAPVEAGTHIQLGNLPVLFAPVAIPALAGT